MKSSVEDVVSFLKDLGVRQGDSLVIHSNLMSLGRVKGNAEGIFEALMSAVGSEGTLVFPTFSFSYCKGEVYNPDKTPAVTGSFPNFLLQKRVGQRNHHPNHSFYAIGNNAADIIRYNDNSSFGAGSVFKTFLDFNAKVLQLGVFHNSFVHYVEKIAQVPYRYDKTFSGTSVLKGEKVENSYTFFVRNLDIKGIEEEDRAEARELFFASSKCKEMSFAGSQHRLFLAQDYCNFTLDNLSANPLFLTNTNIYDGPLG